MDFRRYILLTERSLPGDLIGRGECSCDIGDMCEGPVGAACLAHPSEMLMASPLKG